MARSGTRAGDGRHVVATNRRARHDYTILDEIEAGIVLRGSEVKSLREGQVQVADAYAAMDRGECWLFGIHIAPYARAHGWGTHDPVRRRKLLLHAHEIERLGARIATERVTLIPLSIYFKEGRAKVLLGVARGRQKADKRQAIAERDAKAEAARAIGRQRKGRD
ncbi:MAG: SsrA-binding protein SmpB [Acidimicrobiales bacterium]